eukprot:COSAG01_NODE_2582_length_7421_cov_4.252253_5_plen_60_part_00
MAAGVFITGGGRTIQFGRRSGRAQSAPTEARSWAEFSGMTKEGVEHRRRQQGAAAAAAS